MGSGGDIAKIGLGIVTCDRAGYFKRAIESVNDHLIKKVDVALVYNDGIKLLRPEPSEPWQIKQGKPYQGVAHAKNWLLRTMLEQGCTHLFIMEDDMEVVSPQLLSIYIAAARMNKMPHLNFSQHGPNTKIPLVAGNGVLEYWPNCCGAFSYYTRQIIEEHGFMDENFKGAYEHVEHTWRIYKKIFPYGVYPDVVGSTDYIREQKDALKNSTGPTDRKKRLAMINAARVYWQSKDKDCPLRGGTF
jgi:GT2 family glycosyltransferase